MGIKQKIVTICYKVYFEVPFKKHLKGDYGLDKLGGTE